MSDTAVGTSIFGTPAAPDESLSLAVALPITNATPAAASSPTTASVTRRELTRTAPSHLTGEQLARSLGLPGRRQRFVAEKSFFLMVYTRARPT